MHHASIGRFGWLWVTGRRFLVFFEKSHRLRPVSLVIKLVIELWTCKSRPIILSVKLRISEPEENIFLPSPTHQVKVFPGVVNLKRHQDIGCMEIRRNNFIPVYPHSAWICSQRKKLTSKEWTAVRFVDRNRILWYLGSTEQPLVPQRKLFCLLKKDLKTITHTMLARNTFLAILTLCLPAVQCRYSTLTMVVVDLVKVYGWLLDPLTCRYETSSFLNSWPCVRKRCLQNSKGAGDPFLCSTPHNMCSRNIISFLLMRHENYLLCKTISSADGYPGKLHRWASTDN